MDSLHTLTPIVSFVMIKLHHLLVVEGDHYAHSSTRISMIYMEIIFPSLFIGSCFYKHPRVNLDS